LTILRSVSIPVMVFRMSLTNGTLDVWRCDGRVLAPTFVLEPQAGVVLLKPIVKNADRSGGAGDTRGFCGIDSPSLSAWILREHV
jgi:hypothetical protein